MTEKRFTITQDFEEHHRQIRDNGHIIMGCFVEPQAEVIVDLLNALHEENRELQRHLDVMRSGALTDDKRIKELYDENEQLKSFKSEVFELIDKKINKLKNTNEVSLIPRESVEILKELKKELEE